MANIREHCSWVHSKEKEDATEKAKDITRMSVARACLLQPLQEIDLPVNRAALVVGGGIAGMSCALSIANQGHEVYLLEKDTDLGGTARRIHYTLDGMDVQAYLRDLVRKVYQHPSIHVYTDAIITEATGYVGNFVTKVKSERGDTEIKHGAVVIAVGADVYKPTEYLYGEDDRVMTNLAGDDPMCRLQTGRSKLLRPDML
jgi:heterodisulfide reductase subunit A